MGLSIFSTGSITQIALQAAGGASLGAGSRAAMRLSGLASAIMAADDGLRRPYAHHLHEHLAAARPPGVGRTADPDRLKHAQRIRPRAHPGGSETARERADRRSPPGGPRRRPSGTSLSARLWRSLPRRPGNEPPLCLSSTRPRAPQSSIAATRSEFGRAKTQRTPAKTPASQAGGPLYGNRPGSRRNAGIVIQPVTPLQCG